MRREADPFGAGSRLEQGRTHHFRMWQVREEALRARGFPKGPGFRERASLQEGFQEKIRCVVVVDRAGLCWRGEGLNIYAAPLDVVVVWWLSKPINRALPWS